MTVSRLLAVTAELGAPRIFERSVKLSAGRVAADRGLISMDKRALYPGPRGTLAETCAALGCPDSGALDPYLRQAQSVHFGADGDIGKCYLEFAPPQAPLPNLVFLALKWRGSDVRLNHYTSIADQPHREKQRLIDALVPDGPIRAATHACLQLARDGDPDEEAVVLHVTDCRSARVSVDISVADAKVTLAVAAHILGPLFKAFELDPSGFLDAKPNDRLGHVAVGKDGAGAMFAAIYHGARLL
ncbi:hypothetical protein [Yoonia sp.]|uniref:hypothetical protein n=1 Tax=Yoonia sp. TaxID=2212373 RepID=UPI003F6BFC63